MTLKILIKSDKLLYQFNRSFKANVPATEKMYTQANTMDSVVLGQTVSDKKKNIYRPTKLGPKRKRVSPMFGEVK